MKTDTDPEKGIVTALVNGRIRSFMPVVVSYGRDLNDDEYYYYEL
jgi:hypothetical protein